MITIKEIISLASNYNLKNAKFIPSDAANCAVEIRDGEVWFSQVSVKDAEVLVTSLSKEEIDRIDDENDYYLLDVYKEMVK